MVRNFLLMNLASIIVISSFGMSQAHTRTKREQGIKYSELILLKVIVAPSFKNKTRYTPYVSPGTHIWLQIRVISKDNAQYITNFV